MSLIWLFVYILFSQKIVMVAVCIAGSAHCVESNAERERGERGSEREIAKWVREWK